MSVNSDEFFIEYHNRMAPKSRRQMPVFAQVGKGPRGDEYQVKLKGAGESTRIACDHLNNSTGETTEEWSFPVSALVPTIKYKVYEGVRTIDDEDWWVYYVNVVCYMTLNDEQFQLWAFTTPPATMKRFLGGTVPADTIIDQN